METKTVTVVWAGYQNHELIVQSTFQNMDRHICYAKLVHFCAKTTTPIKKSYSRFVVKAKSFRNTGRWFLIVTMGNITTALKFLEYKNFHSELRSMKIGYFRETRDTDSKLLPHLLNMVSAIDFNFQDHI